MQEKSSWLDHLPRKFVSSVNSLTNIAKTYKKLVGTSVCAIALLTSVHTGTVEAAEGYQLKVETVYHVYVDGQRIGTVNNGKLVDQIVKEEIKEVQDQYADVNLVVKEDIQVISEFVFYSKFDNQSTISKLKDSITVQANAVAFVIGDEEVGYVNSESEYNEVIENLMLQYVSKEELDAVKKAKEANEQIPQPSVGEKVVLDVRLSEEIQHKETVTNPSNVLSVEDAVKQLTLGTLEEDIYVVKAGDVLGSIAIEHGLKIKDILALNPSITEDSLLQIGDELNVTVYEPAVKVIVEEASKVSEEIPFKTETKENSSMWKGDTKVETAGAVGERVVSYSITRENGRQIQRNVLNEQVIKEPINKVVIKGTKVTPSRGSGALSWPTVGGYISSRQGMRWGSFHKGIDIARPSNYNILAADNGTVASAGWDGGYGNKIVINHNNGMRTVYAHLASISVKKGQTVAKGQKIGVMGATGNSTGIHLHFEVYQNGQLKNPMNYLR